MSVHNGHEQMRDGETLWEMFDRLEGVQPAVKQVNNQLRSLPKFEARMMKLKGIKLPAIGVKDVEHSTTGRPPKVIVNPLVGKFGLDFGEQRVNDLDDDEDEPLRALSSELDDILVGAVRSIPVHPTHRGYGICKSTLVSILDKLQEVSTLAIMENYGFGKAHATRYVQAVSLVVFMVKRQNIMSTWTNIVVNAE